MPATFSDQLANMPHDCLTKEEYEALQLRRPFGWASHLLLHSHNGTTPTRMPTDGADAYSGVVASD